MATLSDRPEARMMAANSIIGQVDRLVIAAGDERGDQAKFLACEEAPDDIVFLGVDDDLIYPSDYVEAILAGLDRYPDAIVSFHGWKMARTKSGSLEMYAENYRCLENVWDDTEVHVAGTGVCAFRLSTMRPRLSDFESINADVWMALRAQQRGIPRVVLAHPSYWLGYVQMPGVNSIYAHTRHKTRTRLDGSEGFDRATSQLAELVFDGELAVC